MKEDQDVDHGLFLSVTEMTLHNNPKQKEIGIEKTNTLPPDYVHVQLDRGHYYSEFPK